MLCVVLCVVCCVLCVLCLLCLLCCVLCVLWCCSRFSWVCPRFWCSLGPPSPGPLLPGNPSAGPPKFRSFPLPPQFPSLGGHVRGNLVVFLKAGTLKCARLEFSCCRVKPRQTTKTLILAKNGLAKIGRAQNTMVKKWTSPKWIGQTCQIRMAQNGLAKNGLSQESPSPPSGRE